MKIDSTPASSVSNRQAGRASRTAARVALAIALAIMATGSGWTGIGPAAAANPDANAGVTSVSHEQALEHANDANTFEPGDAVSVPYAPRAGDTSPVDGGVPVALPAGDASGRSMAASPNGSTLAARDVAAPAKDSSAATTTPNAAAPKAAATPAANVLRREVYGFLPYWESVAGPTLNYDILSTVAYFGVGVDGAGNLQKHDADGSTSIGWAGWTSSWMTRVINAAHAHGTRVALTIEEFAWTTSERGEQIQLLTNPTNRANAAAQIAAAVSQRGADGVNLDFEPIASTMEGQYVAFVRALRADLDAIHPGYELTFCGTGATGYYDVANLTAAGAADAVFIMGYDFRTGSSSYAGSIDPLTSPKPVYDLTQVIKLWKARTSVSHIILGLPYYGIAWSTAGNTPNSNVISSSCSATSVFFAQAAALATANGRHYDSIEQSAWTAYQLTCGGKATWRELYYDDAQSLTAKYDMINYWNLRGMGIWALGYDAGHPEMPALVANKFLNDKTPPQVGIANMPSSQTNEGFPVSWIGHDDWSGITSYDVQVSTDGGAFAPWLTGTKETGDDFLGSTGHNYSFRVRATDGAGNVGSWDVTSTYTATPTLTPGNYAVVKAASIGEQATSGNGGTVMVTAPAGTVLQILAGPVLSIDGVTNWFEVNGPFTALNAVAPLYPGLWVAGNSGTTPLIAPITPPNTTAVSAGLGAYSAGTPGLLPTGTGIDRGKVFSPDADGIRDTVPVSWTNKVAMDDVSLGIYEPDGTLAGTIDLGAQDIGAQTFTWDGKANGTVLPDGHYMLQITGVAGSTTYYAPSASPFGAWQLSQVGVWLDTTPSGTYFPLATVRAFDTRKNGLAGKLTAGTPRPFPIAGVVPNVPADAIAVTGNLTVTQATAPGLVVFGSSTVGASTMNFPAGDNRANGVTLGLDSKGALSALYSSSTGKGTLDLIFDLTGYFKKSAAGATFIPIAPTRIVDTRTKQLPIKTPLTAGTVYTFPVTGKANVPANAIAVTGNATITGQTAGGFIAIAPTIKAGVEPGSSTLNFPRSDTRANNVTVQLSGGKLQVEYVGPARANVQFIFDVTGYFVPGLSGATFVPLSPGRVTDSRIKQGFTGPLKNGGTASFAVRGLANVHAVAVAVVGNLTVTGQSSAGWLAVAPGAAASTSTLNFPRGDNRANGFVCILGPYGNLMVTYAGASGSSSQVVVDILGYYR
jgi:spore germination protein YaaH